MFVVKIKLFKNNRYNEYDNYKITEYQLAQ